MPQLTLDGKTVSYTLRSSRRARRLQVRMTMEEGLVVVVPAGVSRARVGEFLESQSRWILKHTERYERWLGQRGPENIEDGVQVWFRGQQHLVRVLRRATGRTRVVWGLGEITVTLARSADAGEALEKWMRAWARQAVLEEIGRLNPEGQFPVAGVALRDQKTRWGSCSRRGNLSFNWRLIMAPPEVLRYVVAHEMAHLREPNHSARFWRLVEKMYGDYTQPRKWLREQSGCLR
jgi:predicted metal-dependent hydrolase